jgi:hypothetical protein
LPYSDSDGGEIIDSKGGDTPPYVFHFPPVSCPAGGVAGRSRWKMACDGLSGGTREARTYRQLLGRQERPILFLKDQRWMTLSAGPGVTALFAGPGYPRFVEIGEACVVSKFRRYNYRLGI